MRQNPRLTDKQIAYRKELLAKIHICAEYKKKKEADAWDAFLYVNYEVETCADLGIGELKNLLDYLCGITKEPIKDEDNRYYTCPKSEFYAPDPTIDARKEAERQSEDTKAAPSIAEGEAERKPPQTDVLFKRLPAREGVTTEKQATLIEKLWRAKAEDNGDRALREFINRIVKVRPLYLFALSSADARKIIAALMNFRVRKEVL
jgi:hypothetical protein